MSSEYDGDMAEARRDANNDHLDYDWHPECSCGCDTTAGCCDDELADRYEREEHQ